jgi:long-chain acyl-CoA synthetase
MTTSNAYQKKPWLAHYDEGVPEFVNYEETCLPEFLSRSAQNFPDTMALLFQGYKVTFRELNEMVDRFAACLAGFGIQKGTVWPFCSPTSSRVSWDTTPF